MGTWGTRSRGGHAVLPRLLVGLALGVAGVLAGSGGALAATTYTSCPTFSQFQSDVQAITGTDTVTFGAGAANCALTATSAITIPATASVTIHGNGLVLAAGTAGAPGGFDLFDLVDTAGLSLDNATLEYGQEGIGTRVAENDPVTLTESTVRGNSSEGVVAYSLTMTNSTVTGNGGNGIAGFTDTVTNSTLSGNGGYGVVANHLTMTNGTISGNGLGAIVVENSPTVDATIFDGNGNENCGAGSPPADQGYNLSTDSSCGFSATGSQNNVTPAQLNLQPLANNGGPTQTQALGPGSIALDAIPLNAGSCAVGATTDQRGVARPQGPGCDVGAYELIVPTVTPTNATAQDVDTSVTLSATVTSPAGTVNEGTVTFTVTDATNTVVGTATSGNVSTGSASVSYPLPGTLAPGPYTITAAYHDPAGNFADSSGTATLTITPGPPASLTLAPGNTTATVGTTLTETATVQDALGYPVADG
ncbi:MAG TPA: choice-of-anchor Q domain-containing protein, partial [Thermomicrobiaceae bacterium]|nr:choice-of-anchor Q domain-containing protein [Thermomicrobiaceae bacterium]